MIENLNPHRGRQASMVLVIFCLGLAACDMGPELAPTRGKVLYRGQPLPFGTVRFQPESGQFARGVIQPDGTFEMITVDHGPGATVGVNEVAVTCFESQRPQGVSGIADGEVAAGRSLIPNRYNHGTTSGLTAKVESGQENEFVFELTD